jgi:D-alanyl-D-alanine carboxypeptidase (penicillin-binding protein 5/6)
VLSCRSWLVANGGTGEVLLSSGADTPVQIASLTKVMTAFIVLAAAEAEAEVCAPRPTVHARTRAWRACVQLLDELVLVSPEASAVGGTTAAVRTGEVYTVRDLLYGMMLPSGNDAAAALAEYLGDAYKPASRSKCVVVLYGGVRARVCSALTPPRRGTGIRTTCTLLKSL